MSGVCAADIDGRRVRDLLDFGWKMNNGTDGQLQKTVINSTSSDSMLLFQK